MLTEGIGGILGPQYIRCICDIPRGPYSKRRVLRGRSNPVCNPQGEIEYHRASAVVEPVDTAAALSITRSNQDEDMTSEILDGLAQDELATDSEEELTPGE